MEYTKPFLTFDQQVELLRSRGPYIVDPAQAVRELRRIGYYRLSAYTYVLRGPAASATGTGASRSDQFIDGATFEQAVALCDFDDQLRGILLTGLQKVEILRRGAKHENYVRHFLRNHCAHNSRIWNRATVYPPVRPPRDLVHPRLHHLREADNNKLYFLAAITAHVLTCLDPRGTWREQFVSTMRAFPGPHGIDVTTSMGFPNAWEELELWQRPR